MSGSSSTHLSAVNEDSLSRVMYYELRAADHRREPEIYDFKRILPCLDDGPRHGFRTNELAWPEPAQFDRQFYEASNAIGNRAQNLP